MPDSAKIAGTGPEILTLTRSRRHWLACFALIAFVFAQSAALLHELTHAANGSDLSVPASERTNPCKECVSHAPLLVIAGGAMLALLLALQPHLVLQSARYDVVVLPVARRAFAARAPPR